MKKRWKSYIKLFLCSLLSFSCSGGDGTQTASGGIGGTGISQGPITEFGSIFVNGVEFETDGATVTIDDQAASDSGLKLGMFVTVKGTIEADGLTGQALTIEFEEDIEGPIDSIDLAGNTLVVMGQTVIVDSATKYENTSDLSALNPNDMVEVSGLLAAGGAIQATLIEFKSDPFTPDVTKIELKGVIQGLDLALEIFFIGPQQVKYTGATFEEMGEADLANGLFVEAEGTRAVSGVLNASRIEKEDEGPEAAEGVQLEIEGFVTSFTSASVFSVNGQAVQTTLSTSYEGGAADDIKLNARLEAEGIVDANGILIASEISFRSAQMKIHADVEGKDVLANTVTLLDQTVVFNAITEIEDESAADQEPLTLSDIRIGDRLQIKGALSGGIFIGKEVRRHDAQAKVLLQGPVDMVSSPDLQVFGVSVKTAQSTTTFRAQDETEISFTTFFDAVNLDSTLKVEGPFIAGEIIAEKVDIEN